MMTALYCASSLSPDLPALIFLSDMVGTVMVDVGVRCLLQLKLRLVCRYRRSVVFKIVGGRSGQEVQQVMLSKGERRRGRGRGAPGQMRPL
jgi:hypothetical protein